MYLQSSGTDLYVCNISSDVNICSSGPTLTHTRFEHTCVVDNYHINNPFLYIFGGDTIYIERINLNTLDKWEEVTQQFSDIDGSTFSFSTAIRGLVPIVYDKYVLFMGGYDGDADNQDIFIFDFTTLTLELFGKLSAVGVGTSGILAQKRMFLFGGYDNSPTTFYDTIYYTQDIPTINPTFIPSVNPSVLPSVFPSHLPSAAPSNNPTIYPSMYPTIYPSDNPTATGDPTTYPSYDPSSNPTRNLTRNPTGNPTGNPTSNPTENQSPGINKH